MSNNDIKASNKSQTLVKAILAKKAGLSKPRKAFFVSVIILFLSLRGRHTFKGMERYGSQNEKTFRLHFEQDFDFLWFNIKLSKEYLSSHVMVFDPSYLPKSGKYTPHIGKFWSGCLGKAAHGMEIGGLGVVDITNNTAFSLEAIHPEISGLIKLL